MKSLQASEGAVAFMKHRFLITWQIGTHLLGSQRFSMLAVNVSAMGHSLLVSALDLYYSISINFAGPALDKVTMGKGRTPSLNRVPYLLA